MEEVIHAVSVAVTTVANGERATAVHSGHLTTAAIERLNAYIASFIISQQLIHEHRKRSGN